MQSPVAIYGCGGLGRELLQVLRDMGRQCVGFVVDPEFEAQDPIHGIKVYRSISALAVDPSVQFVVALGNPMLRARLATKVEQEIGPRFATLVHPRSWIGSSVSIGTGSVVFGLSSISADTKLGRQVLVNPGTTIAHDCELADFATIGPSCALAAGVVMEEQAELGVGVRLAPNVRIGHNAMVGAGAVCIRPVAPNTTVVGVPARPIVRH
jgi:sugar O-acyltransferase (sialic acid O-acetyltransferase NeuD family)